MKLASLRDGSRDGQLAVVARDLKTAQFATGVAGRMQTLLDDWAFHAPQLEDLYLALNEGRARHAFAFDPARCLAPLPRAYQWADGSAYLNHVELVRRARGAEMPASFRTDPLLYQGGSDGLLGARDDIVCASEEFGIDFEAEVAVITDDVPMGADPAHCAERIRLLMLANDVSLRNLIPTELAKGFSFPQLIAHLARTRAVHAGSVIGAGTVSNVDRSRGYCCIAEQRTIETLDAGAPATPFMKYGDRVRIEMLDAAGRSIFGAIEQRVTPAVSADGHEARDSG